MSNKVNGLWAVNSSSVFMFFNSVNSPSVWRFEMKVGVWMASSMSLLVMRTRRCSMLMRSCVMNCSVTLIRGRRECHGNVEIVG